MLTAQATTTAQADKVTPSLVLNAQNKYGDWRDDFFKNGYYIFKSAVSKEKATEYYYKKSLDWLQSFDNGFDLNDKETWTKEHLPQSFKKMYINYCAAHEKFMWDARTEPNVIKPFAELWGTDELIVSFDAFNVTLPGRKDDDFRPWPHCDQAPARKGLSCVQGLINLAPAGPKDGGLLLTIGSSALFEEYFDTNGTRPHLSDEAKHHDLYRFQLDEIEWFKAKGCKEIKVEAEPGDLVLWDSRTIHHVARIETEQIRSVLYVCMTPRDLASPEDLALKKDIFEKYEATTHWPHCNIWRQGKAQKDGKRDPLERDEPLDKPAVTDQILRLAGIKPYNE
ncbi:hypothetical protein N7522_005037 [Penicillium canescens]|nr:hypothetical protein N7522_005037 [Penicillium canescens]